MTWRRFGVLLRGLPQESRYQTALRDTLEVEDSDDDEQRFGPWGLEHYQLASLIDATNRVVVAFGGGDMPDPMPRPEMKRRARPLGAAAVAYLQEIRDRHRRESNL